MKTLVFAEKPSVGKDIARILKATKRGKGFLEGPDYVISWGFGHLVSIGHPEMQNSGWKRWALESLPMLPKEWKLTVLPSSIEQFEVVAQLMNREDIGLVINAADAGREGELIFRLVYQHANCKKPIKRLWISSMTDEAISEGFKDLREGEQYEPLAKAAVCRSRADWLVGMNFTRGYTKKFGSMLTVGRVQTPTLALIVQRHLEITDFKPKDYWEVVANLEDFKATWFDPKEKEYPNRIDKLEDAQDLVKRITGAEAKIKSVKKSKKKQPPPFLYDLTSLQRDANSKFGMTAADTLAVLQNLYEKKKVVTYPRTDSRYLSDDIFPTIPKRLAALAGEYDQYLGYLRENHPKKIKRVFNNKKVSDHHAVIPTEKRVTDTSGWRLEEKRIYDLVVRRFLAVFYPDHQYLSTTIIAEAEKDSFKTTGKVVTDDGWRILYGRQKSLAAGEDQEQTLPDLKKGDTRTIKEAEMLTKKTKPPAAYTESTLLQAMETAGKFIEDEELRDAMKESGLGTPATRAEIIEKLIRVGYMERDKKKLIPTQKGIQLISFVAPEIKSPELTGNWEKRLSDISKSKDSDDDFMKDISSFVCAIVGKIKTGRYANVNRAKLKPPRPTFGTCPACGKGNIIEGKRGFGCDRFKEGCNYVVWKEFHGKELSQKNIDTLIAGKTTGVLKGFVMEDGSEVSGKIRMKKDKSGIELVPSKSKSKKKSE